MKWVVLLSVAFLCSLVSAQATQPSSLQADFAAGRGVSLTAAGVPVTRSSALQLYAPGWAQGYYSSASGHGVRVKPYAGGNEWLVEHHAESVNFDAAETIRRVDDTHVEWTLGGTMKSDKQVRMEWTLGTVNAFALYGGSYTAAPAATTQPTKVLPEPARNEPGAQPAVAAAKQIDLDTRFGTLTFKVEEGPIELTLLDGRRQADRSWTSQEPTFWLGVIGAEVKPFEPFKYRVSVTFAPKPGAAAGAGVTAQVPSVVTDRAFAAQSGPVRVIPTPKSMQLLDGRFVVNADTKLVVVDQSAVSAARSLAREASERFGWTWPIVGTESAHPTDHTILFTFPAQPLQMRPEEYTIDCGPKGLTVTAADNAGHFYAAQTLAQLFQIEDETVYFPACQVDDYPTLSFRGVHLFTGRDAMPLHTKLLERVIARYKMNHLVLQADYTEWQVNPWLASPFSVPKAQVAQYVKLARLNNVEPIPLVSALGHAEWMFQGGRNLDLAEDPEHPYAYSVTNPKTYSFIEAVFDETLALFGPRYLHIGHDEVTMSGRYPHRAESREWGTTKLFLYDTNRLHDYLSRKGVGTMMWGDMLLSRDESNDGAANAPSPEEAARRREGIPGDTIICDWHYTPAKPEDYRSLKVFRDAGFTTIACTWDNPENIYTFAKAARLYGAWGLLQTTWAGYSITDRTVAEQTPQFAAYVLAAEYAWSGGSPRPADLPWSAGEVFAESMNPPKTELGVRPGVMTNLSAVPGIEDPTENFLGMGSSLDLPNLDGDHPKASYLFWSGDGSYPAVVLGGAILSGQKPRPASVTLECKIPAGAREIVFLQATAFPANRGDVVGGYDILYADGTSSPVALRYGQNTRALTDLGSTPDARVGWTGKTTAGVPAAVRVLRIENPNPGKAISGIRVSTQHPYASPILFGVTAVQ